MKNIFYNEMGAETLAGFINRRYREYKLAEKRLRQAQGDKLYWGQRMAQYNNAKRQWFLAESIGKVSGEQITLTAID